MAIRIVCDSCSTVHEVPDDRAGQRGRCPCGNLLPIPKEPAPPVECQNCGAVNDPAAARCAGCNGPLNWEEAFAEPSGGTIPEDHHAGPTVTSAQEEGVPAAQEMPSFVGCPQCGEPTAPKQRRCQGCGTNTVPLLVRVFVFTLAGLLSVGMLALVVDTLRSGPSASGTRDMLIMAPLGVLFWFVFLRALYRGSTIAWWLLTFTMGVGVVGVISAVVGSDRLSATEWLLAVWVWASIIYVGVMWRTSSTRVWKVGTIALMGVVGSISSWWLLGSGAPLNESAAATFALVAVSVVTVGLYSVRTRWWFRVRRGWFGDHIAEPAEGTANE